MLEFMYLNSIMILSFSYDGKKILREDFYYERLH